MLWPHPLVIRIKPGDEGQGPSMVAGHSEHSVKNDNVGVRGRHTTTLWLGSFAACFLFRSVVSLHLSKYFWAITNWFIYEIEFIFLFKSDSQIVLFKSKNEYLSSVGLTVVSWWHSLLTTAQISHLYFVPVTMCYRDAHSPFLQRAHNLSQK